eukprot:gnl/TRDRNA2_/TRDRNA2_159334_c0_seq1.p1 gnl/TRDRNA2_/TRDRNA2_159334_c0~~gnl/TRDRNA2_/TRDRNA2_159334_c0_seq1.p1  ORF type:complete len:382 (-),score=54.13 gnl/TRDRNA2_/TRDRNA2_159334_c0_seq1:5-1150(-)
MHSSGKILRWTHLALVFMLVPAASDRESAEKELEAVASQLPDKTDEVMTVTRRFRSNIVEWCRLHNCAQLSVVELGCYHGHTTSVLSRLFAQVFTLDESAVNLKTARSLNKDRHNIVYLKLELYSGLQRFNWGQLLGENEVSVVFVDASHFYRHVASDINVALALQTVNTLIIDDYGVLQPVRDAVNSYIDAGMLGCKPIGERVEDLVQVETINEAHKFWGKDQGEAAGRTSNARPEYEGLICTVLRRGPQPDWLSAVASQAFDCYRFIFLGRPVQVFDFSFVLNTNRSTLDIQDADGSLRHVGFEWKSYRHYAWHYNLKLLEDTPTLPPELFFAPPRLRGCTFSRDGHAERFCIASSDIGRAFYWVLDDVIDALEKGHSD